MKILFVTFNTCARAFKEAMALQKAGHAVHVLQKMVANDDFVSMLGSCSFYRDEKSLGLKAKAYEGFDIVHVHNEPDWMTRVVREALPDARIIHDCHDLESQRNGVATDDEKKAFEVADGFIFPSESYREGAMEYHGCRKPAEVVFSCANWFDIRKTPLPRIVGGIVYEGGAVAEAEGYDPASKKWPKYRDYWHTANYLSRCGIPFAMMGVKEQFVKAYLQSGAMVFPFMNYNDMLTQMTRFDWGLLGHPESHPQWLKAMPNKLFEYMAAGLPIICINADECAEFVSEHKVGVVVERLMDIPKLYNDPGLSDLYKELKENVLAKREQFVMDKQVERIVGLYKEVVG